MKRPDGFDGGFHPEPGDQRAHVAPLVSEAVPETPVAPQRSADSGPVSGVGESSPGWDAESPAPATAPTAIAKAWLGDVVQRGTQALEARSADPLRDAKRRVRDAERSVKRRERRERKRFSAAGRRKRIRLMIVGGSVVALALFVLIGVFTPIMSVRNIEVTGTTTLDPVAVTEQLSKLQGEPLALVSKGDVFAVLEEFPLIERFGIELIPPSTMIVRIQERTPVISLKGDGGFTLYHAAGVEVGTAAERPTGVPLGSERHGQVALAVLPGHLERVGRPGERQPPGQPVERAAGLEAGADGGARVKAEAAVSEGRGAAAGLVVLLEHEHAAAGVGEQGSGRQPADTSADDEHIVLVHGAGSGQRTMAGQGPIPVPCARRRAG